MKRNFTLASSVFLAFILLGTASLKLQSNDVQPPAGGYANDPGKTNCYHCHTGTLAADPSVFTIALASDSAGLSNAGNVVTTGTHYTPGATHWISLKLNGTNGNMTKYGFQFIALTSANAMAGSFTLTNTSNTSSQTSGTRKYVGHKNANGNNIWSFKWTAPDSGNVTFYYSGNIANGDGTEDNDQIFTGSSAISAGPFAGIGDINGVLQGLNMYPNPFNSQVSVELELKKTSPLTLTLIPMDGSVSKEIFNQSMVSGRFGKTFDISEVPAGVYLIKIQTAEASTVRQIVKL